MEKAWPKAASKAESTDPVHAGIMVGLLFLFMLINFADRAVLGLAAVPIMQELGLSHTEFGLIATSFFSLFSVGGIIGGFLANRIASKWLLAAMALLWSLCQLPMMLSVSVAALVVNRVALGFSEGPSYPLALHATYKWFPNERRAVPTSLIAIGALAGNGIAAPVIVAIIAAWSWRAAFGLLGAVGLVWCIAWLSIAREGSFTRGGMSSGGSTTRLSYTQLFRCRTVIGVQIVGFCAYWMLTLAIIWLPAFLNQAFGYTPIEASWIMMLVSLGQIVVLPTVSILSDGLKRRGVPSRLACGWVASASALAAGLIIILLAQSEGSLPIIIYTVLAFSLCNVMFVLGPVLIAEVTPVERRGAVLGVTNAITTLAGPLAPVITGVAVDVSAHSADGVRTALLIAGGLAILGSLAGFVLIDPEADRARNLPDFRDEAQPA